MIDIKEIGKLIGEEVANEPAIGFYPGGFKPPHKGHFTAAKQLAAKPYINQVKVLVGHGLRDGITAEQSKAIWDLYLKAEPNPKISVEISPDKSPIKPLFSYFANLDNRGYVAGGKNEIESGYFDTLKEKFADRVMPQIINDEFVDGDGERVSGTEFRATISELKTRFQELQQEQKGTTEYTVKLNDYNNTYEYLKSLMPESVINKGLFDDVLRVLKLNFPTPKSLQEGQPNPKDQPQYVWLEEDRWLEEYKNKNKFNPAVFDGENLDPKVKELLLKIATYFWETLELEEPFEDVILTGSSANYNYTPYSDIDLHILIDFNKFENPELIKKYFDSKKVIFNNKHDLKLGKQQIEVYIQDINEPHTSTGVYSIMNDDWVKKPEYESINIPDGNIKRKSKPFKEMINDLIKSGHKNPEKSINQIKKLKERIKNFRQSGLDKNGEYSLENLAFKDLRNTGYLDKLSQLSNNLVDKQLSLNEGTENNIFEKFMSYACQELNIENPPTLEIRTEFGEEQPSFGAYVPSDHHIFLNPSNRNIVDILRTLAHELVHAKQNELELLEPNSGNTGSDIENDANAIAGILMRDYGKNNPDIYSIGVLNESKKTKHNQYKEYFLKELFEKDLPNIEKISPIEYIVGNGNDIEAKYYIKSENPENTNWSIHFKFTENNKNNSSEAWKQVTATSYKILSDFINNKHPKKIEMFGDTPQKTNLYKSKSYLEKLKAYFDDSYIINNNDEFKVEMISINEVAKSSINKRMENLNESYEQALNYFKYGDLNAKSKIERNRALNKQIKKQVMNEIYNITEERPKITRIYLDMDGVIAGFDEKFRQNNKDGIDFKDYIKEYGANEAWKIINDGGSEYWSSMGWNPGGKQLYDYVTKMADKKDIEVWVLSSPGLDPNGDTTKGKNEWLDKNTSIPQNQRVFKRASDKHTEAQPGYLLIDDMGRNVSEFINAGGYGIKNNPENSMDSIKKLHKFGL